MKRILLTKVFILLLVFSGHARAKYIDSLIVSNQELNSEKLVYLIALTSFPNTPTLLNVDSLTVSLSSNVVTINSLYISGNAPSFYKSKDTIKIGKLNPGTYKLIFNLKYKTVTSKYLSSKDSLFVTVSDIGNIQLIKHSLLVYPNPAYNQITVHSSNLINELFTITDQAGRKILTGQLNKETNLLDISNLAEGFYFLEIGEAKKKTFKILKR